MDGFLIFIPETFSFIGIFFAFYKYDLKRKTRNAKPGQRIISCSSNYSLTRLEFTR